LDRSETCGGGNFKESHYYGGNGSNKIVWIWACGITSLFVTVVGAVVIMYASTQSRTNESVAMALTELRVEVGSVKTQVNGLERTVDRLADSEQQ